LRCGTAKRSRTCSSSLRTGSARFRQFLTPQQFASCLGLRSRITTRSSPLPGRGAGGNRHQRQPTLLQVEGTVRDVEKCLRLNLHAYRHPTEDRTFHAPDAEPSLDLQVQSCPSAVWMTSTFSPMRLRTTFFSGTQERRLHYGLGAKGYWLAGFPGGLCAGVSLDGAGEAIGTLH